MPGWQRVITRERDYCPDCGGEISEDNPVSDDALEAGDDAVCSECWDTRQREREEAAVEAEIYRREVEIEDGADIRYRYR